MLHLLNPCVILASFHFLEDIFNSFVSFWRVLHDFIMLFGVNYGSREALIWNIKHLMSESLNDIVTGVLRMLFPGCFATLANCDIFWEKHHILESHRKESWFGLHYTLYYTIYFLFVILFDYSIFHDKNAIVHNENIWCVWKLYLVSIFGLLTVTMTYTQIIISMVYLKGWLLYCALDMASSNPGRINVNVGWKTHVILKFGYFYQLSMKNSS
jgi:hypothetical protein